MGTPPLPPPPSLKSNQLGCPGYHVAVCTLQHSICSCYACLWCYMASLRDSVLAKVFETTRQMYL